MLHRHSAGCEPPPSPKIAILIWYYHLTKQRMLK